MERFRRYVEINEDEIYVDILIRVLISIVMFQSSQNTSWCSFLPEEVCIASISIANLELEQLHSDAFAESYK